MCGRVGLRGRCRPRSVSLRLRPCPSRVTSRRDMLAAALHHLRNKARRAVAHGCVPTPLRMQRGLLVRKRYKRYSRVSTRHLYAGSGTSLKPCFMAASHTVSILDASIAPTCRARGASAHRVITLVVAAGHACARPSLACTATVFHLRQAQVAGVPHPPTPTPTLSHTQSRTHPLSHVSTGILSDARLHRLSRCLC